MIDRNRKYTKEDLEIAKIALSSAEKYRALLENQHWYTESLKKQSLRRQDQKIAEVKALIDYIKKVI